MCYLYPSHKNVKLLWKFFYINNVNISGHTDNVGIANEFAEHFNNVYYSSGEDYDVVNNFVCHKQECVADMDVNGYDCINHS